MNPCIFIALDGLTRDAAISIVKKLSTSKNRQLIAGYKIHDLWDSYGPIVVSELKDAGAGTVWVDLKLNDTPKTTGLRAAAVSKAGADIISVHASSGLRAIRAAVQENIKVVVVTVLTSLERTEIQALFGSSPRSTVLRLAHLGSKGGAWGLVCSAEEVGHVSKTKKLDGLVRIVPGIQMSIKKEHNQKRIGRPAETLKQGATYIVVGAAFAQETDPADAFERIAEEIHAVFA